VTNLHKKIFTAKNTYSIPTFESKVISIKNLIFVEKKIDCPYFNTGIINNLLAQSKERLLNRRNPYSDFQITEIVLPVQRGTILLTIFGACQTNQSGIRIVDLVYRVQLRNQE
jgi:hypothetical protein